MSSLLPLLSLLCITILVGTVCVFVRHIGGILRAAERSVHAIDDLARAMRDDGAAISPGIEAMNQNLYRVAMHLGELGEAAEQLAAGER